MCQCNYYYKRYSTLVLVKDQNDIETKWDIATVEGIKKTLKWTFFAIEILHHEKIVIQDEKYEKEKFRWLPQFLSVALLKIMSFKQWRVNEENSLNIVMLVEFIRWWWYLKGKTLQWMKENFLF